MVFVTRYDTRASFYLLHGSVTPISLASPMTDASERLAKISDSALKDLIARMREAQDTSKAPYTLAQLLMEEGRRTRVGAFPTIEAAQKVLELAQSSPDGLTTYKEVYHAFRPDAEWKGNAPQNEVTNALGRVGVFCIANGLPLISTLVVNSGTRDLTEDARNNLYNFARERGVDVGSDRDTFIAHHQERARQVAVESITAS